MYKTLSRNLQHAASKINEKRTKRGPCKVFKSAVGGQILEVGSIVTGRVKKILNCGVIIALDAVDGMVHVTEISERWVQHPLENFNLEDTVSAVVIGMDIGKNRVSLSIKRMAHDERKAGKHIQVG